MVANFFSRASVSEELIASSCLLTILVLGGEEPLVLLLLTTYSLRMVLCNLEN